MKKFKSIFVALAAIICFASCGISSLEEDMEQTLVPFWYEQISADSAKVFSENGSLIDSGAYHPMTITADTIKIHDGETAVALSNLNFPVTRNGKLQVPYSVGASSYLYNVEVSGYDMSYKKDNQWYTLKPRNTVSVVLSRNATSSTATDVFCDSCVVNNVLTWNGSMDIDTAIQKIVVNGTKNEDPDPEPQPKDPEFVRTVWSYNHSSFQREASLNNGIITVLCNNIADFKDLYDDNMYYNEKKVNYVVSNKFNFSASEIKVDELNTIINKSFTFNNGTAVVGGVNINATWKENYINSAVMHNDINYADSIAVCKVVAQKIIFSSATEATIRFYDKNANDYAEVSVPVQVTENEKITLREITKEFNHIAFRKDATVSGANIAVICDNNAKFVKVYSNNTSDDAVNVAYTWVNNFTYNIPTIVVNDASSIIGNTYTINNGVAEVEGYNVTVTFANRAVSDIMFDSKNYKSEAPICEATPTSIRFNNDGTATITFDGEGETITAVVPATVVVAEIINGKIIAGWGTDAYKQQIGNKDRTDLHILTEENVVYSRQFGTSNWTSTPITAAQAEAVKSSGRAIAWIWNGSSYQLGTVRAVERTGEKDRYMLEYYTLEGQLAYRLGKSNETIGNPFRYPIVGELQKVDGRYEISYEGTTYYFVSK